MEYTRLGSTGLEVSRLWLGCANFGAGTRPEDDWEWTIDDPDRSKAIIDRAIDAGITVLDTANMYSTGDSESIVGDAIASRRDEVVLATKVGGPMADRPNGRGLSRKHVLAQAAASRDRLGIDTIDLYQVHIWDESTPIAETLSALDHVVGAGTVTYIGASNFSAWQLLRSLATSTREGYEGFVSIQPEYNLVTRGAERSLFPVCRDHGIGVVTYSPLAAGFLAGRFDRDEEVDPTARLAPLWDRLDSPSNWETYDRVRRLADEKDASPVQVSVAWVLANDVVDAAIVGPESVGQLEEYLGALAISLSDAERTYLTEPLDDRR